MTYTIFKVGTSAIGYGVIEKDITGVVLNPFGTVATCLSCPCTGNAWMWCSTAYIKMMRKRYNILG